MRFRDVQHFYLGCECVLPDGSTYTLQPSHLPSNWKTSETGHKPLLFSLDDITSDDKKEMTQMWLLDKFGNPRYSSIANITHYLTSKSYDVFGLIDSGHAIRKIIKR